jgi:hypothetical protein
MSAELDLRSLHQPHEPDPAFLDALEQRLETILTRGTASTVATPGIEDGAEPDLYPQAPAPRPDRRRWYRRAVFGAAAAVLLVAVIGVIVRRDEPDAVQPATPATVEEWTPEQTRAEGSPVGFLASRNGPSPSGLDAEVYCIGPATPTGSPCDRYHPYDPEEDQHWALEVTQGGRSALFDLRGPPWAMDLDEDSILVQDGTARAVRFRLLQADGTAVQLRVVSDLAPAVPGPDVVLIEDLDRFRLGMIGPDGGQVHPYLVDDRAGTLQLLDVPEEIEWWGPNVDQFLWGGNGCRAIWQQPDGTFEHHDADCLDPDVGYSDPGWNWVGFADWLEPGLMALVEWRDDGAPLVVHASLDRGATWERIEIEDRDWADTTEEVADALEDALRPFD